jgi:hypothetical protein
MTTVKIFVSILLSLCILACSETIDTSYKNIDEAMKHGAFEKGWLPNILPRSSYEIYERHDLDTNTVWLRFKFDKRDINELIAQLEEIKQTEIERIEFPTIRVKWWPKNLSKDSFKQQPNLKIYKYDKIIEFSDKRQKTVPSFFVIDWNLNIAYYWQYSS